MSLARFTQLYMEIDATTRTVEKVEALRRYFREADPADAAWALYFFTGRRLKRVVTSTELWNLAIEVTQQPEWMLEECYSAVGDFSETLALLLPPPESPAQLGLAEVVQQRMEPMRRASAEARRQLILRTWNELTSDQRFIFHKLISGEFRVGVSKLLTVRGAALAAGIEGHEMAHRVMGDWAPTPSQYTRMIAPVAAAGSIGSSSADGSVGVGLTHDFDPAALLRPYPFYLAHQLNEHPSVLGDPSAWQVEWKWDGTRCQMIRRGGTSSTPGCAGAPACSALWSRGEELVSGQFPELLAAAGSLPPGTVLDGEVLAWDLARPMPEEGGRPLNFAALQKRLNRKNVGDVLFHDVPVIFLAYDVLEHEGRDVRGLALVERRAIVESIVAAAGERLIRLSPVVQAPTWEEYGALRATSRERGVEGLMLKPKQSVYGVGRTKREEAESAAREEVPMSDERDTNAPMTTVGANAEVTTAPADTTALEADDRDDPEADRAGAPAPRGRAALTGWWKWKIDPYTIDAVMIYAQRGSGRRASLYTDYTFGVWDRNPDEEGAQLVPIAKAYSGLTDEEIDQVDRFVRGHAVGKRGGSFRVVEPVQVFELAFEGIARSDRHKSGIALRFPRMARWRTDKPAREADTLERVRGLLRVVEGRG